MSNNYGYYNTNTKSNPPDKKDSSYGIIIFKAVLQIIVGLVIAFGTAKLSLRPYIEDNEFLRSENYELQKKCDELLQIVSGNGYPMYASYPDVPDFGVIRGFTLEYSHPLSLDTYKYPGRGYHYNLKLNQSKEDEFQAYEDVLELYGFEYEENALGAAYSKESDIPSDAGDTLYKGYNNSKGRVVICAYGKNDGTLSVYVYDTYFSAE